MAKMVVCRFVVVKDIHLGFKQVNLNQTLPVLTTIDSSYDFDWLMH